MGSDAAVGVVDKAVALLLALESGPAALVDVVAATGIPRATAHRLLVALVGHGMVARQPDGRFALGPSLARIGAAAAAGGGALTVRARPALEVLRDETGESVQLYVRSGDRRVCMVSLESPHGLRTIVDVGASLPLDLGSAGAVLRDDPATRRRGWAESVEEREAGVASVSAPVRGPGEPGPVLAAVSVSGPLGRTTRHPGRLYAAAVVAAAGRVELALAGGA